MRPDCTHCSLKPLHLKKRPRVVSHGRFYRRSDSRWIRRFRCLSCKRCFSHATLNNCYRQKKRKLNRWVGLLMCQGMSQRAIARTLRISRVTVVRKLLFLAGLAETELTESNQKFPPCSVIEFDDMETSEHTKCKPLSITLAVESGTRRILGFEVSKMPAKGKLVYLARKKYGPREDGRKLARRKLFKRIAPLISKTAKIKSDENPHYESCVRKHFPEAIHETFKGKRGCIVGQGELKKIGFDPLFSLNHTCAMFRANVNRLFRRTWCTTKSPERLRAHLFLYAAHHNRSLKLQ